MGDFLSFRVMVTPVIVKILYVLGAIGIVVSAFSLANESRYDPWSGRSASDFNFWIFLAVLVVGELAWRILCETMILLFQIHDELVRFNKSGPVSSYTPPTTSTSASTYTPSSTPASGAAHWTCSSCGTHNVSEAKYCNKCGDAR